MTFAQVVEAIFGEVLLPGNQFSQLTINHVVSCDLMSDVLVTEFDDPLLVTSLPSDQVARTADMVGACGIVLVNGKTPQPALIELSQTLGLTLIRTKLSSFEVSWRLGNLLHS